ncbi:MAG: N-acetylneuraminate synthase family protein [Candidatus Sungiibacteriota bacterium]|uniref:N-acetylneuraminate synthase family protein n=1 Tax=Candidatus Sungiibacteriota bacterium TaxID=2750080 RepID=A0A7T5RJT9_9BACT|nr:MAG: N-acetylneuraminate synthase family protein [Candidatus Sungbacteria bacterium]
MRLDSTLPRAIKIRDKYVGEGHPTFVIAEVGNNHNGEMELARKSVISAALAGADAVKFQRRRLNEVFTQDLLSKPQTHSTSLGKTYGEYRQKLELSDEQFSELKNIAHSLGLAFFVTAFDLKSAESLAHIGMDCWKIASFDVNNRPLLEFVAKIGQPVFMSTGMADQEEMDEAVNTILKHSNQLIIKHCVSIYPTPDEDLNIGAITAMRERYRPLPVGYSGHEVGFVPTIAAVTLGAASVERHFTLDKALPGPDHSTVSLDPLEFTEMVKQIRRIERAVKDREVRLHDREISMRNKHGKSLVSKIPIPQGTLVREDMLTCKSPGHGIKPTLIHTVVGKTAKVDIPADTVLTEDQIVL